MRGRGRAQHPASTRVHIDLFEMPEVRQRAQLGALPHVERLELGEVLEVGQGFQLGAVEQVERAKLCEPREARHVAELMAVAEREVLQARRHGLHDARHHIGRCPLVALPVAQADAHGGLARRREALQRGVEQLPALPDGRRECAHRHAALQDGIDPIVFRVLRGWFGVEVALATYDAIEDVHLVGGH